MKKKIFVDLIKAVFQEILECSKLGSMFQVRYFYGIYLDNQKSLAALSYGIQTIFLLYTTIILSHFMFQNYIGLRKILT